MSEWIDTAATIQAGHLVADAMGVIIDGVTRARETDNGVEVWFAATDHEGNELVGSSDGGETLEPLEAHMMVPGGMIIDASEVGEDG